MMYELEKTEFERVRELFNDLKYQLATSAVINGICPGIIHVDDPANPTCSLMWTSEGWFLAGDSKNVEFKEALGHYVEGIILRNKVPFFDGSMFWFGATDEWIPILEEVFPFRPPQPVPRVHYTCVRMDIVWKRRVPDGFTVKHVNEALLTNSLLNVPDHLRNWITSNWGTLDNYLEYGFGFCTTHENVVVSWSLADAVSETSCEIGIQTKEEYRRRGLASVTAAAVVQHALSNGFSEVGWHAEIDNEGSIGVAEKLGFVKERDYLQFFCAVSEAKHLAETAIRRSLSGKHEEAISLFDKALGIGDIPLWTYYFAVLSTTMMGQYERAIDFLSKAAAKGWWNPKSFSEREEFIPLHDFPEWTRSLASIEKNRE